MDQSILIYSSNQPPAAVVTVELAERGARFGLIEI
jgi:hypothetical protein